MKDFIRYFKKQQTTGWLSIVSLSLGTMVAIMIGVWSINEFSFDRFHKDGDRIYRVTGGVILNNVPVRISEDESLVTVDEQFMASIPQVEEFTYFSKDVRERSRLVVEVNNERFTSIQAITAKENFFTFFTFPLKQGNPETALNISGKVVIDETTATMLFPKGDAMGQMIKLNGADHEVSGVMYDIPRNSNLQTRMVIAHNKNIDPNLWGLQIYHRLAHGADVVALQQKFTAKANEKVAYLNDLGYQIFYQPLLDIHFSEVNFMYDPAVTGSKMVVRIYITVAIVILLLACINFTNLFASNSFLRAKAVGVKQVLGARRSKIRREFYMETACYAIGSLAIGLIFAMEMTPHFNQRTGSNLFIDFSSPLLYVFLAALFGVIVVVAGSMPAFRIARMNPLETIKGTYRGKSMSVFQKGLTIVQFTASIALLIITLLISNQVNFMLKQSEGYNRENVIFAYANIRLNEQYETLRTELMREPAVMDVTITNGLPTTRNQGAPVSKPGDAGTQSFEAVYIKQNYFEMMGMQFVAGENPVGKYEALVLNETAVRLLGLENPIDQTILLMGTNPVTVKGVVRDATVRSLHKATDPQIYISIEYWVDSAYVPVMIKINGDTQKALAAVEKQWRAVLPDVPFEYRFLDDEFEKMYLSEKNLRNTLSYAMFIGFAISVAGLFAMAFYSVQRRRKEIAIRKVLGASVTDLLLLLNKGFMLWILISYILGSVIAWCFMKMYWLKSFIVQAPLSIGVFVGVGLVAILVAALTVSWQTWTAATTNPVNVIKKE